MGISKEVAIRFVRLFLFSAIIVAVAWALFETEILGGVRDYSKVALYAVLIGVCIATAQIVLDPRVRAAPACPPCPECEMPVQAARSKSKPAKKGKR